MFPRLALCLLGLALALGHASTAADKDAGSSSRGATTNEPIAKLPPPIAPGMEKNSFDNPRPAPIRTLPPDVEIESAARPAPAPAPLPSPTSAASAEAERKIKLKAHRERLNQNALRFQQERAAQGSLSAMRVLAMRYFAGDGVEKNDAKGIELLRKAAAGGDIAAKVELAKRESRSEKVKPNDKP